jgi:hypothetical protein
MNQFGLQYIYTWKCHKETPCVAILNKQKCHFSKTGQEGKTGPIWGWLHRGGEDVRKGCGRVNLVEYYALMYENGKMRPVETVPGMGEGG